MKLLLLSLSTLLALGASAGWAADREEPVRWKAGKGTFHTARPLGRGDEVRIRMEAIGTGQLDLVAWHPKKKNVEVLRSWASGSLRRGEVVRAVLPATTEVGLQITDAKNRPPKEQQAEGCFDRLRFGGGWRLDVKVIDATF